MIRTIKQRLYFFGLLPLVLLAVALVALNGLARIKEADRELAVARNMTVALLQGPAVDALVVGNILSFEQAANSVIRTSPAVLCITLRDVRSKQIARAGRCEGGTAGLQHSAIRASANGFSDFEDSSMDSTTVGELGLAMNDRDVVLKRREILVQLALSLVLIVAVLVVTGRMLRARLIAPIHRIGGALLAVGQRDYSARVPSEGDDELSQLAEAINRTIATVAEYTRELERRRNEADQALQDADTANLARDGLVRALTEDLAEPLNSMHAELTSIAMANTDTALKERIKSVMARLQEAQSDFADLVEIATHVDRARTAPLLELANLIADMERDINRLSAAEHVPINVAVTQMASAHLSPGEPTGVLLDLDGVRLKKAILHLIRAMARRCGKSGVHVNLELIKLSTAQLHVSVHLTAFYEPAGMAIPVPWVDGLQQHDPALPRIVGLTDREGKIIDYLLRTVGVVPTVSASPSGAISLLLELTCRYTLEEFVSSPTADALLAVRPISAIVVSDDLSLLRYTTRGDMSNHELRLVSFSQALAAPSELKQQDVLLIDISEDVAEGMKLLSLLKSQSEALPQVIAIGPPGVMSDTLADRLFEHGFSGMLQKPLQHSRLVEVIRTTLAHGHR